MRNGTGCGMPHRPIEAHPRRDGQGKVGGVGRVGVLPEGVHAVGGFRPPIVASSAQRVYGKRIRACDKDATTNQTTKPQVNTLSHKNHTIMLKFNGDALSV